MSEARRKLMTTPLIFGFYISIQKGFFFKLIKIYIMFYDNNEHSIVLRLIVYILISMFDDNIEISY